MLPSTAGTRPGWGAEVCWISVWLCLQLQTPAPDLVQSSASTSPSSLPLHRECWKLKLLPFVLARLLPECRHIQLLQSSEPRAASFTIQLFQMLNHSVAYLHCELSVCLHGKPGCEQVRGQGPPSLASGSFGKIWCFQQVQSM